MVPVSSANPLAEYVSAQQWVNAILRALLSVATAALLMAAVSSWWRLPLSADALGFGLTVFAMAVALSGAADLSQRPARQRRAR